MALSPKVKDELLEAQSHLRAALRDSAVNEKSVVCKQISDIIFAIESIEKTENLMDKLESRKFGDSGTFGSFFNDIG
jgi:hypothetical protein